MFTLFLIGKGPSLSVLLGCIGRQRGCWGAEVVSRVKSKYLTTPGTPKTPRSEGEVCPAPSCLQGTLRQPGPLIPRLHHTADRQSPWVAQRPQRPSWRRDGRATPAELMPAHSYLMDKWTDQRHRTCSKN